MEEHIIKITHEDLSPKLEEINKKLDLILFKLDSTLVIPPVPEPNDDFIYLESLSDNMNTAWRLVMQQEKYVKLLDNKQYFIDEYETVNPLCKGVIGNLDKTKRPSLIIGSWIKSVPSKLFYFTKVYAEFAFVGVNVLQPKGQIFRTALQDKFLFDGELNVLKTCKLALIGSEAIDKDQMSWSLTEIMYSGGNSDIGFIDIIAKDVKHNGPNFTQLKTKQGNNIRRTLWNVELHNPRAFYMDGNNKNYLTWHYYNPTYFIRKGIVSNNSIKLLEDSFDLVKTHHGYEDINVRCIVNVGRFVFNIYNDSVNADGKIMLINPAKVGDKFPWVRSTNYGPENKTFVSSIELQAGDITSLGKIIEKQIQNNAMKDYPAPMNWARWNYVVDRDLPITTTQGIVITSTFNIFGETDVMFAYKYSGMFSSPFLTEYSKFNDWYISYPNMGIGYSNYDMFGINEFWLNVIWSGYLRFSGDGASQSLGYNLENVVFLDGKGEWSEKQPFNNKVTIPQEVMIYIETCENLAK
jgi:hypothetical protein